MEKLNVNDILLSCEIELNKEEYFNVVLETLERIGMYSKKTNTLFQSCYILHKKGKFYIVHFKELYALDNNTCTMDYQDLAIRNLIANILENWGLIKIITPAKQKNEPVANIHDVTIIPHKDKKNFILKPKYTFYCMRKKK